MNTYIDEILFTSIFNNITDNWNDIFNDDYKKVLDIKHNKLCQYFKNYHNNNDNNDSIDDDNYNSVDDESIQKYVLIIYVYMIQIIHKNYNNYLE
jgi:hypothetical protein